MKKILSAVLVLGLLLSSCSGGTTQNESDPNETTTDVSETLIQTVEDMTEIDSVLAVTRLDDFCTTSETAYKVEFESDGLKQHVEIALPADYAEKDYPTVLYFPDVGYDVNFLVDNFAKKDVIVVRMFRRGSKGNEGTHDFCDEDFADAKQLMTICLSCDFLSGGGIVSAGAVMGSTYALKLAAEYPDEIMGCATVDAIFDFESLIEFRGESIKELFLLTIGCSEDELSAELDARSPKNFAESITVPVMLFAYEETPFVPKEHSAMLQELLDKAGSETELIYMSPVSSDFNGTAFMKLIPWIKSLRENAS